jgi:quercetin 2,3-dioxygenase
MFEIAALPAQGPWPTLDPFLFCVHHLDRYPRGKEDFSPVVSLAGRNLGSDFSNKDGFSMYHGETVPGFPRHPHRGFETVTIARSGFIDHSDSLGATARFGTGDGQWMTAGRGIVHSEMFPLVNQTEENPAELFQLWINLPSKSKMAAPHFTMMWDIPVWTSGGVRVQLTAGRLGETTSQVPPPSSWAADPANDVTIWSATLKSGASWTVPASPIGAPRIVYFFVGKDLRIDNQVIPSRSAVVIPDGQSIALHAGDACEVLILGGRPIEEPVAAQGPFVMNTREELVQAFADYRATQFGGWPWTSDAPHHARAKRFAIHADGRKEERTPG